MRSAYNNPHDIMITGNISWPVLSPVVRTLLYFLGYIVTILLLTYFFTTGINNHFSNYVKKILFITTMFSTGVSHIFSFSKCLPHLNDRAIKTNLLYSLLLAALIALFTGFLFFYSNLEMLQPAITAACSFLLPTAFLGSWNYFDSIAAKTYPTWYLPVTVPLQKMGTIFLNSLQIKIRLKSNCSDVMDSLFTLTVPGNLQIGKMFHRFLMDTEQTSTKIQLLDQQQQFYGWRFILRGALVATVLDPESTISDNDIKANNTILVERIKVN